MTYLEDFPNWVSNDTAGNRKDTAVLLVGTATEAGLVVRHHIASTTGGFYITDALADLVYEESEPEPEPEPQPDTTTSGNRAAKKKNKGNNT